MEKHNVEKKHIKNTLTKVGTLLGYVLTKPIDNYNDLLQLGRTQLTLGFDKEVKTNVTGIEPQLKDKYLSQMIALNDYVYTTYSTLDYQIDPLSIGFTLPLDLAKKLVPKLRKVGYWFTLVSHDRWLDYELNDAMLTTKTLQIHDMCDLSRYHFANTFIDFELGNGWYECNNKLYFWKHLYFHYPTNKQNMTIGVLPEPCVGGYCDVSLATDRDNPLVTMTVEDPDIEKRDLYGVLLQMLKSEL